MAEYLDTIPTADRTPEMGDFDRQQQADNTVISSCKLMGGRPAQEDALFATTTTPRETTALKAFLERSFAATSPRVNAGLIKHVEDKIRAESINYFQGYIKFATRELEKETDPTARELFTEAIADNEAEIEKAKAAKINTAGENTGGTTATVAVASPDDTITVANLGDSPAVLFVAHPDGTVSAHQLSNDHSASDAQERKKAEALGGKFSMKVVHHRGRDVEDWRMLHEGTDIRAVNMTRGFGDLTVGGFSKEPDIIQEPLSKFRSSPEDRMFLCVSSDGLYGSNTYLQAQDYAPLIGHAITEQKEGNIAGKIADYATMKGSHDNISVMVTELKAGRTQDIVLGVCDGHGNSAGSAIAASTLKDMIEQKEVAPASAAASVVAHPSSFTQRQ